MRKYVCYLENVGEVSQVEDVVKANRRGEEVLADFLVQTDCCLDKQNHNICSVKTRVDRHADHRLSHRGRTCMRVPTERETP